MSKRRPKQTGWKPFQEAEFRPMPEEHLEAMAAKAGVSVEHVRKIAEKEKRNCLVFLNNIYQVTKEEMESPESWPTLVHLSIKRIDRRPIHDWRHLQRIKNELLDPECEAVELYPAESRRVDTSNQYHLFALKQPGRKFPFGFPDRAVTTEQDCVGTGAKQRPFEKGE